jgi:hypothetical protein
MARNRNATFEKLSDLSLTLRNIEDASHADLIVSLAAAGWLTPLSDDDLFELFVLTRVLRVLTEHWGEPLQISPLRMREAIATWKLPHGIFLRLHFDAVPLPMRDVSTYLRIARNYAGIFNANVRRPDITLSVTRGKRTFHTLIEIKNPAEDSDDYRRQSLYKCLGYIADFGPALDDEDGPDVCLLVFPDFVPAPNDGPERVSVVSGEYGSGLADRIVKRLESLIDRLGQ